MKHKAFGAEHQRMAGVGTALETGNHLVGRSEHIYHLAFSLVAPLEAEHYI